MAAPVVIPTFEIKRGDTVPALPVKLVNPDGTIPNLAGATVLFKLKDPTTGVMIANRAASITDLPTASVTFLWQASETALVGLFNGEFQVTFANGSIGTYPNKGYLPVRVNPDNG